jgi:hypothetical protein
MNTQRKKLFQILNQKLSVSSEHLYSVVDSFSDFKVSFFLKLFTSDEQEFQAWLHDQLLLKEGKIEALERQYRYLVNDHREAQDKKQSVFF